MSEIPVNLVFEDSLSESVLLKLLQRSGRDYRVGCAIDSRGFGWIRQKINGLNRAARGMPYLVLTDLDRAECPPVLVNDWLRGDKHPNLIFRIAVRQVEAWLLACREACARFLGVQVARIPSNVDEIPDAKKFLIALARRSRNGTIRTDIVPSPDSTAKVGPNYNGRLILFVKSQWDPTAAQAVSPSLRKTMRALDRFTPVLGCPGHVEVPDETNAKHSDMGRA